MLVHLCDSFYQSLIQVALIHSKPNTPFTGITNYLLQPHHQHPSMAQEDPHFCINISWVMVFLTCRYKISLILSKNMNEIKGKRCIF